MQNIFCVLSILYSEGKMFRVSPRSVYYVIIRNYMSFRSLFKISIVPNLIDPLFYLIAMGFGVGAYLTNINGMSYTTFVITGLIGATAMTTATSEATVNAFIQYKIEKTYAAMLMTPINLQDIVIGQAIWSGVRAIIFGGIFWLVSLVISQTYNLYMLFIIPLLFLIGLIFGLIGLTFTYTAPSREFLNYYNTLVVRPLYMFSDTFFPIDSIPEIFRSLTWFSPLYHATNIIRAIWIENFTMVFQHLLWLIGCVTLFYFIPILVIYKMYYK